jgi:mannose-6-phosphate isomerase-like protein (cupin superfamily)
MKRRSFLKASAALLPAAGLQNFALAQASSVSPTITSPSDQVHIVGAGQDGFGESHSLGFSSILFKVLPRETGGGLFVIEHIHLANGGPALHYHLHQEEFFYVMEGEVLFQVGDRRVRLRSGESVLGPRNIPHTFTSVGETPGRLLIAFTPAGLMEEYFRAAVQPGASFRDPEFNRRFGVVVVGPPLTV